MAVHYAKFLELSRALSCSKMERPAAAFSQNGSTSNSFLKPTPAQQRFRHHRSNWRVGIAEYEYRREQPHQPEISAS